MRDTLEAILTNEYFVLVFILRRSSWFCEKSLSSFQGGVLASQATSELPNNLGDIEVMGLW